MTVKLSIDTLSALLLSQEEYELEMIIIKWETYYLQEDKIKFKKLTFRSISSWNGWSIPNDWVASKVGNGSAYIYKVWSPSRLSNSEQRLCSGLWAKAGSGEACVPRKSLKWAEACNWVGIGG